MHEKDPASAVGVFSEAVIYGQNNAKKKMLRSVTGCALDLKKVGDLKNSSE